MSEFNSEEKFQEPTSILQEFGEDKPYSKQLASTLKIVSFLEDIHTASFESGYKMGLNAQLNQNENEH